MNKTHILPTTIAMAIGISGVLLVLFAWHLPPFRSAEPTTENAYIRGRVTSIAPQLSGYVSEVYVHDFQEVKQGDPIARIDDRIYRQKLAQAQAGLETARAALAVSEQNVRSAEAVRRANEAALASARAGGCQGCFVRASDGFGRTDILLAYGQCSTRGFQTGLGLCELLAIDAVVDPGDGIALLHLLEVVDIDLAHITGQLWRD